MQLGYFEFKLANICLLDHKDAPTTNDVNEAPVAPENTPAPNIGSRSIIEIPQSAPVSAPEEDTQEIIVVNENTTELDLNHGRIGKIENLEPLKNLER